MILVVTQIEDVHADFVIAKLNAAGASVCRFHPDELLAESNLEFNSKSGWNLRVNDRLTNLKEITSVYFRKPVLPESLKDTEESIKEFCENESRYLVRAFLSDLSQASGIRWVNNYHNIRLAENKPKQLSEALHIGLNIPATLITNDPDAGYEFYSKNPFGTVLKALVGKSLPDGKGFYTSRLEDDLSRSDFESIGATSTFLQSFVDKAYDLRIVIVENDLFAIRIDSQVRKDSSIDVRATRMSNLTHTVVSLPSTICDQLHHLVNRFGLVHAEIDMCVTKEGEYVFFEMNPNGQWLWLELQTGARISDAFANTLLN